MENSIEVPQETKNIVSTWCCNPYPAHIFRENSNSKGYNTPVFIATLFTIAKTQKQPKCPSTDEWIKKMWYIYNGILFNHKKNEIMSFAATWMDQEIIILSEVSQEKIYHRMSLLCVI